MLPIYGKSFAERSGPSKVPEMYCTPPRIESCASVDGKWPAQLRDLDHGLCKDNVKDSCQRTSVRWPSLGSAPKSSIWISVVGQAKDSGQLEILPTPGSPVRLP